MPAVFKKRTYLFVLALGIAALCPLHGYFCQRDTTKKILSQYPLPVLVSPDGKRALLKSRLLDDFELRVVEIGSEKEVARTSALETQLALAWSPEGNEIAFLATDPGQSMFILNLWDLRTNQIRKFSTVRSKSAALPLRWSPDSKKILFYGADGFLEIVEKLADENPPVRRLVGLLWNGDFSWSPSGEQIAFTSWEQPGAVTIVSPLVAPETSRTFMIAPGGNVRDITWSADGSEFLVSSREAAAEFYSITKVTVDTGEVKPLVRELSDVRRPVWLARGRELLFERVRNGVSSLGRASLENPTSVTEVAAGEGSQRPLSITSDGATVFLSLAQTDKPPTIASYAVETGKVTLDLIHGVGKTVFHERLAPQQFFIKSSDGLEIPFFVWKPQNHSSKAILYIHGGPHLQELPDWDMRTQLAVEEGYTVAVPNYRGSVGYGGAFERWEDLALQVQDVLAVARYITTELKIEPSDMTVAGSSYGTTLALATLKGSPHLFSRAVLTSLLVPPDFSCAETPIKIPLHIFLGARDPIAPPEKAKAFFHDCLGKDKSNSMTVFSDEGHHFHRTRSQAKVYARMVNDEDLILPSN